jgi:hypothetical protein
MEWYLVKYTENFISTSLPCMWNRGNEHAPCPLLHDVWHVKLKHCPVSKCNGFRRNPNKSILVRYCFKYYYGDKVKEDAMGEACSKRGSDGKYVQNFDRKTLRQDATRKT